MTNTLNTEINHRLNQRVSDLNTIKITQLKQITNPEATTILSAIVALNQVTNILQSIGMLGTDGSQEAVQILNQLFTFDAPTIVDLLTLDGIQQAYNSHDDNWGDLLVTELGDEVTYQQQKLDHRVS